VETDELFPLTKHAKRTVFLVKLQGGHGLRAKVSFKDRQGLPWSKAEIGVKIQKDVH
jgi:hypothetical protein